MKERENDFTKIILTCPIIYPISTENQTAKKGYFFTSSIWLGNIFINLKHTENVLFTEDERD
jgi:hypothetical protein